MNIVQYYRVSNCATCSTVLWPKIDAILVQSKGKDSLSQTPEKESRPQSESLIQRLKQVPLKKTLPVNFEINSELWTAPMCMLDPMPD